jgi:hypothetical protein
VTPYNTIGYTKTLKYGYKFTHVSPAWFYLEENKNSPEKEMILQGMQDLNLDWL